MNFSLKVNSFSDIGVQSKERLIIKAVHDTDLGSFLVLCTDADGGVPLSGDALCFWFPDQRVKAGDLIVVYTKDGTPSKKSLQAGGEAHFFYWSHPKSLWNQPKRTAVLMQASGWVSDAPQPDAVDDL